MLGSQDRSEDPDLPPSSRASVGMYRVLELLIPTLVIYLVLDNFCLLNLLQLLRSNHVARSASALLPPDGLELVIEHCVSN